MRRESVRLVIGTAIGTMVVTLLVVFGLSSRDAKVDRSPLILKEVRQLGELRTVSQGVNEVYEYQSHRIPEGWAAHVPLVKEIVAATTSNRVLVRAEADVQAGVDLSLARVVRDGGSYTVTLPAPEVFEPVVKVQVFDQKDGMFWRDLNISGKAQEAFSEKAKAGSLQDGILETAKVNAERQLRSVLGSFADEPIAITFAWSKG